MKSRLNIDLTQGSTRPWCLVPAWGMLLIIIGCYILLKNMVPLFNAWSLRGLGLGDWRWIMLTAGPEAKEHKTSIIML